MNEEDNISPARRGALFGAVGLAAVVAGGVSAWMKFRPHDIASTGAGAERPVEAAVWSSSFESLNGDPLHMKSLSGKPVLLNFWATWCPPCVDEFPLIDSFYRQNLSKWHVLGLAIDQRPSVEKFLARIPVSFPIAFGGLSGTDIGRKLGNESGGLPFTAIFDSAGSLKDRKIGQLTPDDLQRWSSTITN